MTTVNEEEIKETLAIIKALDDYATTSMPEELLANRTNTKPAFMLRALIKVMVSRNLLSEKDVNSVLGQNG
jgi:hypothetical protein